jgi:hypothetical protein
MRIELYLVLGLAGCNSYSAGSAVNAALNTGVAAIASGATRANGGCYAVCTHGLVCNRDNGRCEARPCLHGCASSQRCDQVSGQCEDLAVAPVITPTPTTTPTPPATQAPSP